MSYKKKKKKKKEEEEKHYISLSLFIIFLIVGFSSTKLIEKPNLSVPSFSLFLKGDPNVLTIVAGSELGLRFIFLYKIQRILQ
ncbi:hypothetical protein GQ457_06G043570 [Hibiscus cannabinus]